MSITIDSFQGTIGAALGVINNPPSYDAVTRHFLKVPVYVETLDQLREIHPDLDKAIFVIQDSKTGWFHVKAGCPPVSDPFEGRYVILNTPGWYAERYYEGNFNPKWCGDTQAAFEAAQLLADDLDIDQFFDITEARVWPRGKRYFVRDGGGFTVDGVELIIRGEVMSGIWRGPVVTGPNQIFNCINGGKVLGINTVWPEWWGAKGDTVFGTGTNDQPALQAAHDCCEASTGSDGGIPTVFSRKDAVYGLGATLEWRPSHQVALQVMGGGPNEGTTFQPLTEFNGTDAIHIRGIPTGDPYKVHMEVNFALNAFSVVFVEGVSSPSCVNAVTFGDVGYSIHGHTLSLVSNVRIMWFRTGIKMQGVVRLIKFDRLSIWAGPQENSRCLEIVGTELGFVGDLEFAQGCQLVANTTQPTSKAVHIENGVAWTGDWFNQIAGIKFERCCLYNGNPSVTIFAHGGSRIHDIFFGGRSQWDGYNKGHIAILSSGANTLIDIVAINDCWFYGNSIGAPSVSVMEINGGAVEDFHFTGNRQSEMLSRCIEIYGCNGAVITSNIFRSVAADCTVFLKGRNIVCNSNLQKREAGVTRTVTNMIKIAAGSDYVTALGNNSGGCRTGAAVVDFSGSINNQIGFNI